MRRCGSGRGRGAQNLRGAISARVLRGGCGRFSGSRADGGGEWGWKGRMEGATGREICPGERTVVVKINGSCGLKRWVRQLGKSRRQRSRHKSRGAGGCCRHWWRGGAAALARKSDRAKLVDLQAMHRRGRVQGTPCGPRENLRDVELNARAVRLLRVRAAIVLFRPRALRVRVLGVVAAARDCGHGGGRARPCGGLPPPGLLGHGCESGAVVQSPSRRVAQDASKAATHRLVDAPQLHGCVDGCGQNEALFLDVLKRCDAACARLESAGRCVRAAPGGRAQSRVEER